MNEKLREIIRSASKRQPRADNRTLSWFTLEKFLPMHQPHWAPSTQETNLYTIVKHIFPAFGEKPLTEIDKFDCQMFLNKLAKAFSHTVVAHCRTMLKAILEEALEADYLAKNPAWKLITPETRQSRKPVMDKLQTRILIESLPVRDRLIVMVAAFCAMRPGEIFGLRWSSFRVDHFQIEGTAWRGTLRPGKAKTEDSLSTVAIPPILSEELEAWHAMNPDAAPNSLIFPSESGTPMRPENWLRRRVKPQAALLGITIPVNFQVMRRSFATNAQRHGTPKDVQAHLRHTDSATTMKFYQQPIEENVIQMANDYANDLMGLNPVGGVQ